MLVIWMTDSRSRSRAIAEFDEQPQPDGGSPDGA